MSQAKQELRAQLFKNRAEMDPTHRAKENEMLLANLTHYLAAKKPKLVAAYVPGTTEPGGNLLIDEIRRHISALILPVSLEDRRLDWALYEGPESLSPGAFGIQEPTGTRLGPEALKMCDVIIAPALAVTPTGIRMGKGGGFYDRALATGVKAEVLTLLFSGEILDDIPVEEHDRPVHIIITPAGIRNLGAF
ncbi:5-formyltetrahydrofolate cyclo-ligase [Corynebacterium callunae]|uniref:5-formyltetrahydrofolate cyclo-ligase n=1 Tax=Corynebacterium callunae TaxID=1721 RepID=UPI0039825AA5